MIHKHIGTTFILIVVTAGIVALMRWYRAANTVPPVPNEVPLVQHNLANTGLSERNLIVGGHMIQVEVAQEQGEKQTGLSHRSTLLEGKGMLFVFENEGRHGIWMKDMHFSIDIIWINAEYKIVHIEHNISPETYPKSFSSALPARYVLEIPAGYAKNKGILVGENVLFE